MKNRRLELKNIEIHEYCSLNLMNNHIEFYHQSKRNGFTGLYYKNYDTFFALYPTENGPTIYYQGSEYQIHSGLHIKLQKNEKARTFTIKEYQIKISYQESPYIGFDSWSDEIDVDLFYLLTERYQKEEFYQQYTLNSI